MTPITLVGHWDVRRESGILPRFGFSKRIREDGRGITAFAGIPLFPFRVVDRDGHGNSVELVYRLLPIRDELDARGPGWRGRGLCFGVEFCRFRMEPRP